MISIETNLQGDINSHYLNRYIKFITTIYNKGKRKLQYKEKHHIIPKCINKDLYTNPDNIIILTPREHYIAHLILSHCYKVNTNEYNRLIFALFAMTKLKMKFHNRNLYGFTSKQYENLRIKYAEARRSYMKIHINDNKYQKLKGKEEPATNKGKIGITNGIINKYINKTDSIPEGWRKGFIQSGKSDHCKKALREAWKRNKSNRIKENHPMYGRGYLVSGDKNGMYGRHRKWINKNNINKIIFIEDLDIYLKDGWNLGKISPER